MEDEDSFHSSKKKNSLGAQKAAHNRDYMLVHFRIAFGSLDLQEALGVEVEPGLEAQLEAAAPLPWSLAWAGKVFQVMVAFCLFHAIFCRLPCSPSFLPSRTTLFSPQHSPSIP